jgi:RNA polymerase sigma-70 factor (ECF subfamily)
MLSCAERFSTEFGCSYVVNLKSRDPQTEAHFAAYFSRYLESKLRGQLRSRDLADDIRQETLVRVLEAVYTKKDLKHPERFGAFVNSVCNNVLLEHWRRKKTAGETLEVTEQIDSRRDPESTAQLSQDITQLRKVLLKLHKRDRDLLRMIYWEECDRHEVSRITQTSADHVRVMLHRAKRALRRYLDRSRGESQIVNLHKMKKASVLRNASASRVTT